MKISIIIPVLSLNDYSIAVMKRINEDSNIYLNLHYLFVFSDELLKSKVIILLKDFTKINNVVFYNCNNNSSNYLRKLAIDFVETDYVYYQDCDDDVNYSYLNSIKFTVNFDNVYCFNIERIQFNQNNMVIEKSIIYNHLSKIKQNQILQIHQLPTNIVNKIIPISKINQVVFYNLPFTQDWSISYQLFLFANHYFIDDCIYKYNNYPFSSSNIVNTQLTTLKRVHVFGRIIVNVYKNKNLNNESKYLKYRYDMVLQERYFNLGVKYIPSFSFKNLSFAFKDLSLLIKVTFNLMRSWFKSLKMIINSSF
ncbi:MAG: hypothetical protein Q7U47_06465 [Paludibacter sp.]|nr:hypothetical protein [Paludibacter sp.]